MKRRGVSKGVDRPSTYSTRKRLRCATLAAAALIVGVRVGVVVCPSCCHMAAAVLVCGPDLFGCFLLSWLQVVVVLSYSDLKLRYRFFVSLAARTIATFAVMSRISCTNATIGSSSVHTVDTHKRSHNL